MNGELIGYNIGGYTLLQVIGRGGTATVYYARSQADAADVAIKVIDPVFARPIVGTRQFEQAAQAVAGLQHPHILPILDVGRSSKGHLYIVMAYLTGGTLARRIAAQPGALPLAEVVSIAAQVGSALDYAHARGVIHRDVKPGNILLDANGDAYLTDFGMATFLDAGARDRQGLLYATYPFMAPEFASGAPPGPATDIYALGVTLYEMLVGHRPFDIHNLDSFQAVHGAQAAPDPADWPAHLGPGLRVAITQALHPDPDARPPHAASLVYALERAAAQAHAFSAPDLDDPLASLARSSRSGAKPPDLDVESSLWEEPMPLNALDRVNALDHMSAPDTGPIPGTVQTPVSPFDAAFPATAAARRSTPQDSTRAHRRGPRRGQALPVWSIVAFTLVGLLLLIALALVLGA